MATVIRTRMLPTTVLKMPNIGKMLVKKPWNNTKEYNQPEFPLLKIYL